LCSKLLRQSITSLRLLPIVGIFCTGCLPVSEGWEWGIPLEILSLIFAPSSTLLAAYLTFLPNPSGNFLDTNLD
jgi:hypothetical protein